MKFFSAIRDFFLSDVKIANESFPFTWSKLLLQFVLPVAVYFGFYRIVLMITKRILRKSKLRPETQSRVLLWIRRILRILYLLLGILLVGRLFGAKILSYLGLFYQVLSKPFFESGSTKISIITLILTIPIFYLASWSAKGIRAFLDHSVLNKLGIDEAKKFSISNLIRYVVLIIILLIGLSIIGINVSSLAVLFGVLGIGLGFGLQNMVANIFAGIVIIFTRPIKEGDRIWVSGNEGVVVKIRMLATVINTIKNETIIVPNAQITGDKVYNYSHEDRSIIIENSVEIAYWTNLELAIEVMQGIGERCPYRLFEKKPIVRVVSFESSGISLHILTWIRDVNDKYDAHSWTNIEIWRDFKANNVEIPFPQVDLHFRNSMPGKGES